jgi:hypothetical protein
MQSSMMVAVQKAMHDLGDACLQISPSSVPTISRSHLSLNAQRWFVTVTMAVIDGGSNVDKINQGEEEEERGAGGERLACPPHLFDVVVGIHENGKHE